MLRSSWWSYIFDKKSEEVEKLKDALMRACEVLASDTEADVDRDTYFEDFLRAVKYENPDEEINRVIKIGGNDGS